MAVIEVAVDTRVGDFHLSARFESGAGLTALFGRSGAGKTMLVDCLAGLRRPDSGRIAVNGQVLFDSQNRIDLPPERRRLGYVFQDARLFPHLSVRGNLTYGLSRVPTNERHHDLEPVADLLDIRPLLKRRPGSLSGGEQQRVAIGRAVLASPRLLLMDEPLASLDGARKAEILPFIERLRDQLRIPIVYVSHAVEEVIRLADTIVLVDGGQVIATGGVEETMSRLDLRPLTGRFDAGAVLTVTVTGQDKTFGLTDLTVASHRLRVPWLDLPLGTRLRLRIRARDVAISLERPKRMSVLNVLEGRVAEIETGEAPQVDVRLDVGAPLIARITRKSLVELDLLPGTPVFALVKAIAIDRHALGRGGGTWREAW